MKKTTISLLSLFLLSSVVTFSAFAQVPSDLLTVFEGAETGDALLSSGTVTMVYDYVRVDSLSARAKEEDELFLAKLSPREVAVLSNTEHVEATFTFDGRRMHCKEVSVNQLPTGRWYDREWHWSYDGEKMELLRLDGLGDNGLIVPMGSVRTDNDMPLDRYDPRYYGQNIKGAPVGEFLKGRLGRENVHNVQKGADNVLDGVPCKAVSGTVPDTGETVTAWLAPGYMYRPKRIEIQSYDRKITVNTKYRESDSGVWVPSEILKETYAVDQDTKNETLYIRETLVVKDFQVNRAVDSGEFRVPFPVGLSIYDYRIGRSTEIE